MTLAVVLKKKQYRIYPFLYLPFWIRNISLSFILLSFHKCFEGISGIINISSNFSFLLFALQQETSLAYKERRSNNVCVMYGCTLHSMLYMYMYLPVVVCLFFCLHASNIPDGMMLMVYIL